MKINQQDVIASEAVNEYLVVATRDRIYVLTEPGRELVKQVDFNYEGKESHREDALKFPYAEVIRKVRAGDISKANAPAVEQDDEDSLLDQMRSPVTPAKSPTKGA